MNYLSRRFGVRGTRDIREKSVQSPDANDCMTESGRVGSEILLREMVLIVKSVEGKLLIKK